MAEITNELLKKAIADANAVRDMAIANAKIALEETFTPQIKSMLAKRLRAEAAEELSEGGEKAKEQPFQDATHVSGGGPQGTSTIGSTDNKEPSDDASDSSDIGNGGENKEDGHTDWYDDWSESDFDLDEVIRELEEDVQALSETDDADEEDDDVSEGWNEGDEGEGEEEEDEENEGVGMAAGQKQVGAMPAASPAGVHTKDIPASSSQIGMAKDEADAADPHKFTNPQAGLTPEEMGGDDLDLEAIIRELEAQEAKDADEKHQMASRMGSLQKELAEYRKVVEFLRGRLNEVNLLNAKLLYTNKIFRKEGLSNEQKVNILETFDRAVNVREVKMVYATLVEAMTVAAKTVKNRTASSRVVTEGLASKATPSTAPKKAILEENTVSKRLQELAGIL